MKLQHYGKKLAANFQRAILICLSDFVKKNCICLAKKNKIISYFSRKFHTLNFFKLIYISIATFCSYLNSLYALIYSCIFIKLKKNNLKQKYFYINKNIVPLKKLASIKTGREY